MGPGRALSSLAQANGVASGQVILALRHPEQAMADDEWHMASIARLWACGVKVDWAPIWGGARRRRVPLPSYAFQRKDYFIEAAAAAAPQAAPAPERLAGIADWGWAPHWKPAAAGVDLADLAETAPETRLVFIDATGLATEATRLLRAAARAPSPRPPG